VLGSSSDGTLSFNDQIESMDLANMRANGVRSLDVQCHNCRHPVIMNVDHLPGDMTVPSFGPKMVNRGSRSPPALSRASSSARIRSTSTTP
jgi:hypothetical protein